MCFGGVDDRVGEVKGLLGGKFEGDVDAFGDGGSDVDNVGSPVAACGDADVGVAPAEAGL